jgi:uncharacterized RDD family membrane protein YckC
MKCPKCGYLGFEATERCRHCGYDFSLAVPADPVAELPLNPREAGDSALLDLDLDRVIGADTTESRAASSSPAPERPERTAPQRPTPSRIELDRPQAEESASALPLFTRGEPADDPVPLVPPPRPARPPLSVRRATPDMTRRRTPRAIPRETVPELQLEPAPVVNAPNVEPESAVPAAVGTHDTPTDVAPAPKARRIAAALVDLSLLVGMNLAVVYLTVAIVGLSMSDALTLPPVPMGAFLLLLNGGYLVAFTAANGQTIGKMLFSVRVIGEDSGRVDVPGSVLRAAGVLLTVVTCGLAYVPALLSRDGRALHDRLAKTRVIRHA